MSGPPANPEALPQGFVVGGYRVLHTVGRGAFGTVYGAVRLVDGTRAAVKVMTGRVLDLVGGVDRFRREGDLARRLTHPNIVRVFDAGIDGGLLFTAFELLEGHSLEDEIARAGPLPLRRVGMILSDVLAGLEEAHRADIIHRDLKPANLFLALTPRGQEVKILDFGVAKSINPNTAAGLTREGIALGTPAYMAPEQLAGQPATPATDIFALGLVAAELVMGRSLYGPNVSAIQILNERIHGSRAPVPPYVLGSPLGAVIARALSPAVAERFTTATEMRAAVVEALAAAPVDDGAARAASRPSGAMGATFPMSPAFAATAAAPIAKLGAPPSKHLAATVTDDPAAPAARPKLKPALAATVRDEGAGGPRAITIPQPPPSRASAGRRGTRSSAGVVAAVLVLVLVALGILAWLGKTRWGWAP